MHSNAANTRRFSYAARFGRGGSPARHMVKLLMGALMILGMATQAQAVVEQEAPIPGACFSSSQIIGCTPSVRLVADTSCLTARGGSPINITRIDFTTWSTDCQLGGTFRIIGSVSCPVPTVNPTVPYSYNANTSMCEREQQVQYTISLHNISPVLIEGEGLGGEMAPNASRNAYANVGVPGVAITLTTAAPFAAGSLTLSPHQGSSGVNGRLNFIVTAPSVAGTHTVTATCDGGKCSNEATGTIVVTACPVPALTAPPFTEVCAQVLESINSTQAQKDAACGALTPALKTGMSCLRDKLTAMTPAIPMRVTSDIRSIAYQAHLRQVWDRMEDVVDWMVKNPTIQTACAARRAEIAAEKGCDNAGGCTSCYAESAAQRSHCLVVRPANPSPNDALHTQGNAFDVSQGGTINPLLAALAARDPPQNIQQFLNAPTNCNLNWGGSFDDPDPVHFHVPVP